MKILVVALDNLGDAVMATALLGPLRRLYPAAELGLWVKSYAAGLLDLDGVRVHAADPFWDRAPGRGKGELGAFLSALGDIRKTRYNLAFVLNADWRRALACRLAGIPERVGHAGRKSGLFLTRALPPPAGHVVERHASLLAAWSGGPVPAGWLVPEIGLSSEQKEEGLRWRKDSGWEGSTIVAVHALTGDREKNWPLAHWSALIRDLLVWRADLRFALLSSEREAPLLREACGALPESSARVVVSSVAGLKPILSQAGLFLGGDSGPGHMAAALGVPTLSLFGPTDPGRYRPIGAAVKVLRHEPLAQLEPEEAARAVRELLASRPSA